MQRELAKLERLQWLHSEWDRGRKYYQANERSPLHEELCARFQTGAVAASLRQAWTSIEAEIDLAFVCQAWSHLWLRPAPLQLIVLADDCPDDLHGVLESASRTLGRGIEPLVLEPERGGYLIEYLLTLPRIWVKGTVTWCKPAEKTFGVRFDARDERRQRVKEWVESYLES
jgi:hypothetical protein